MSNHPLRKLRPRRIVYASAILAGVIVCGLTVLWRIRDSQSSSLPEIHRTDLVVQDGRFYQPGDTNAFTGWVLERYETGSIKSRSMVSDGLLHGISEGWHTNGQLQVREHFRDGVSSGLRTKWYDNGQELSEVMIVDGKLDGTFRRWHANGELAEQIELAAGQPHGLSRAFYESGFLKAEASLECGQLVHRQLWQDGEKKAHSVATVGARRTN